MRPDDIIIRAGDLVDPHNPTQQAVAVVEISNLLGYLAARIVTVPGSSVAHLDPVEVAEHAQSALEKRLIRERDGELHPDQPHYSQLDIASKDFSNVARAFARNSIASLVRHRSRDIPIGEDGFDIPRLDDGEFAQLEDIEEHGQQIRRILDHCSGAEKAVLTAVLATGFDKIQAAHNLGVTVNYIDKVLSRIRKKIAPP